MDLSCGRGLMGATAQACSRMRGATRYGEVPVGWVPPHPTAPAQGTVQQLLSTGPPQQTAGAPHAPDTPKGARWAAVPRHPTHLGVSQDLPLSPSASLGQDEGAPLPGPLPASTQGAPCPGAQWSWVGAAPGQLGPPVPGRGCGASLLHLACSGAPALPACARDTLAPSRLFPGVSGRAAHALLIHRRLHPPKTPLPHRGCGILGWAGEGSLCPAASGRGGRWPGTDPWHPGRGWGLQAGTKRPWGTGGARVSMHVRVWAHACPGTGAHVLHTGGWGPGPGSPPSHEGPPPTPALGHFLLRQNCWFFLLINLTDNLMSGSDFPCPALVTV